MNLLRFSAGRFMNRPYGHVIPKSTYFMFCKTISRGSIFLPASLRDSAHTVVAIRISRRPRRKTDCHTSDIGHWFAMTGGKASLPLAPLPGRITYRLSHSERSEESRMIHMNRGILR